jgi:hypothetical protein
MNTGNIPERDKSARYENDAGDVTTFYRLMMTKKGGDVEKVEDDTFGGNVAAYRVDGELFRAQHPEWITEVRESDTTIAEVRERHVQGGRAKLSQE